MDLDAAVRTQERDSSIRRGVFATLVSRAVSAVTGMLVLAVAARSLDQAEFGLVVTLVSIFVLVGLADLGVSSIFMTRLAEARARDDIEAMRHLVRNGLIALGAIGGIIMLGGGLSAFLLPWHSWIGGALPERTVEVSVALLFVLSGAVFPALVAMEILRVWQRLATVQFWFAAGSAASLIACLGAAAADLPPWAFMVGIVGMPTFVAIGRALWLFLVEYPHLRPARTGGAAPGGVLDMLKASGYLGTARIAAAFALSSQVFIVALIMGPEAAAVFGVASRMFALLISVVQAAGGQMWPALTDAITRGDLAWAQSRYRRGLLLVGGLTGLGCLVLVIAGQPLAWLWVGPELVPPIDVLLALAVFTLVTAVCGQAMLLPLAVERIKGFAIAIVALTPVGVALSVFLTHELGLVGPALGGLLTQALLIAPFTVILCRRTLNSITSTSASIPMASVR
jgi:O-antigen/teichoic acid export membrane protein